MRLMHILKANEEILRPKIVHKLKIQINTRTTVELHGRMYDSNSHDFSKCPVMKMTLKNRTELRITSEYVDTLMDHICQPWHMYNHVKLIYENDEYQACNIVHANTLKNKCL